MHTSHRIDELLFDVHLTMQGIPLAEANTLRIFVVDQLLPMINALFDQLDGDDVIWRFDYLDVDVGDVTLAQLPDAVIARLRGALLEAMDLYRWPIADDTPAALHQDNMFVEPPTTSRGRRIECAEAEQLALLAFLAHGLLPDVMAADAAGHRDRQALERLLARVLARDTNVFLRAVATSSRRDAMLTRLAHHFAPTSQQTLLAALSSGGMAIWMSALSRLEAALRRAGLSSADADGAWRAAWRMAFSHGLAPQVAGAAAAHDDAAVLRSLLVAVTDWLAQQQRRSVSTAAQALLKAWWGERQTASAQDASGTTSSPSGLEEILGALAQVLSAVPTRVETGVAAPEQGDSTRVLAQASIRHEMQEDSQLRRVPTDALHSDARVRISEALLQGEAADVAADWSQWLERHPGIVRSTLLHYGADPAVADRLASTYPLSMLIDMLALLDAAVVRATATIWNDATLASLLETENGDVAWRRHWWCSALARLLAPLGGTSSGVLQPVLGIGHTSTAVFTLTLEIARSLLWPEPVQQYLASDPLMLKTTIKGDASQFLWSSPSVERPITAVTVAQPQAKEPVCHQDDAEQVAFIEPLPLAHAFAEIGAGRSLAGRSELPLAWLMQWVEQAVPDVTFRDAISRRAEQVPPGLAQHHYYARVLDALALQQAVDLEQFVVIAAQYGTDVVAVKGLVATHGHEPDDTSAWPLVHTGVQSSALYLDITATVARVLVAIREGRRLSQEPIWPAATLRQWVEAAVPDRAFLDAIVEYAAQMGQGVEVRIYYARVLEALALHEIVDLEQCASVGLSAGTETLSEPAPYETSPEPSVGTPYDHSHSASATTRKVPAVRSAHEQQQKPKGEVKAAAGQEQEPLTLTQDGVFAAIRAGRPLADRADIAVPQLMQWLRTAVRASALYDAIVHHAIRASDIRRYYARVLDALARNHIVDLERLADTSHLAPEPAQSVVVDNGISRTSDAPAATLANGFDGARGSLSASSMKARLATAFMRADPAQLYTDWDVLVYAQPTLLLEALRHYGSQDRLLEQMSRTFPESMLRDMAVLLLPQLAAQWDWLHERVALAAAMTSSPRHNIGLPSPADLAQWRRQLWYEILRYALSLSGSDEWLLGSSTIISATDAEAADPMPSATPASASALWTALEHVLYRQEDLHGLPWQREELAQCAATVARAPTVLATGRAAVDVHALALDFLVELDGLRSAAISVETAAGTGSKRDLPEALNSSISEVPLLPSTVPETTSTAWRMRFAQLATDVRWLDGIWASDALQALVEAHLHAAKPTESQQRQRFVEALLVHAPGASLSATSATLVGVVPQRHSLASASMDTVSDAPRRRYWRQVLQALLSDQSLDLEDIVVRSHAPTTITTATSIMLLESAVEHAPHTADSRDASPLPASIPSNVASTDTEFIRSDTVAGHLAYLRSADFSPASQPPADWLIWLRHAIATSASGLNAELTLALINVSRHGPAVHALLTWLPPSLWHAVVTLSPRPAMQVRHLLAVASDVADVYAQAAGIGPANVAVSVRRFLLPWLFQHDRGFDLAYFCGQLVSALGRDLSRSPDGLAERLHQQLGVSLAAAAAPVVTTAAPDRLSGVQAADVTGEASSVDFPEEGMAVANAGMVLLWPFLSRAWDHLQLTGEGRFLDHQAIQRAVWLLQHAVFGHVDFPEYRLPLNKLLSGMSPTTPIVTTIEVSQEEDALIEQLLGAMITHWSALGNTSVNGLRETFLQRSGHLLRKEDGWHLHIPVKTFDMLLDRLPWSIGTIRLPWMQDILWVTWR